MTPTDEATHLHLPLRLPTARELRELLEALAGRAVTAAPGPPLVPGPRTPVSVAAYADDRGRPTGVVCVDLALGAALGGALGLVPADRVADQVRGDRLGEELAENLDEVLNICAGLMNADGHEHVRLVRTVHPPDAVPSDLLAQALVLGRRLDLGVDVPGRGEGRISVVLQALR